MIAVLDAGTDDVYVQDMSENLRNFAKALYGFDAVVQRVQADQWDADTPCDGWCAATWSPTSAA